MTFSREIWSRRAVLLLVAALFLIGNLVFFFAYGTDTRGREQALEERKVALDKEVAAAEAEAARLSGQRDRLAQVSSALEEFYGRRVGPSRDMLAPLVDEVHALLRRADLSPAQISYQTSTVPELPLSEMTISFGFRSDYAKFKRLLHLIETSRRWIIVRETALARDPESPSSVDVRLTLATYFSGNEGSARPPVAASPGPFGPREARRGTFPASPRSHDRREARRVTLRSPGPPGRSQELPVAARVGA